ncbi:MAG: F(420)H(2) dehydrogenase subunit F [Candidatus Methanophagaceae archaeon]|nr:MAG: F(420)H(2) dehydrogenase subunit F [Methanophagales archaeon]KAF5436040.1 coenzyme F420 hydrogenase subunit beta [Methanophagales archaeon]
MHDADIKACEEVIKMATVAESKWEIKVPDKPLKDKVYFENLKSVVIDTEICSRCLTCAAVCPGGITVVGDKVDFPDYETKCLDCGACVRVCPRFVYEPLSGMGPSTAFIAGRSKRFAGQDGAMVTELIVSAMEMGIIDRGLFAGRNENWETEMFHVRDPEQLAITTLSGTKYTFADVLPELKKAVKFTKNGVGVVGTPCIVSGVRKLQQEYPIFREKVKLVVGLFCTENFHYSAISQYLRDKGVDFSKLVKTDITMGKFIATMTDNEVKFKVKALEEILPSGCNVCCDFTAVEADVSVGSVGSVPGFSTISVREPIAQKILDYIKKQGYAEFGEGDPGQLGFLVGHKKKRAENLKK